MATIGTWQTATFGGMSYKLLLPDGYAAGQTYPVLLFLHGGGQEGALEQMLTPWFNTAAFRARYPAIVVAPVLPNSSLTNNWGGYATGDTGNQDKALAILQQVIAGYGADRNRIYVTGDSLGGHGTWDLIIRDNAYDGLQGHVFAAGLSVAGFESAPGFSTAARGPNSIASLPTQAVVDELRGVPLWAVQGSGDDPEFTRAVAAALPNSAYRYTELDLGHDVWDTSYPLPNGSQYYDWLFSQTANVTAPPTGVANFLDTTTSRSGYELFTPCTTGPEYLKWQYIWSSADDVALSSTTPNVFLHSGTGRDSIQVTSGQNVLDGGAGSNFLTGGSGTDTFFTDARGSAVVWNTLRNFHAGDAATLWGFVPGVSSYTWDAAETGAAGATGATLRANIVGGSGRNGDGIDASITFAGLSVGQARSLQVVTGTQGAGPYLYFYNPGV